MPAAGASELRRGLEGGVSLPESVSQEGNGDSRDRRDGEQWGTNWVGGSSAEIRKLAEQIRTRFGREALVRNRNSTEALQASNGLLRAFGLQSFRWTALGASQAYSRRCRILSRGC